MDQFSAELVFENKSKMKSVDKSAHETMGSGVFFV